ncbi:DUF4097 family beta strand repeat-containing protein [Streptomyces sp. CB02115]|uniref:DUF4097 family beta strand repeat-containing protein n=1 Tax=Streptomyces sp. CB02115 TaxID=1703939 RepID=UPI00093DCA4C|nr:DUF4097 family beta strand repeat-containing protein [Streptomyces sp. CB02115]OKJ46846.1 hypothetical protein AMK28_37335 [Streptomyces sp. CB02115]
MTTRKFTAETAGPVTIDATLLGHGGIVTVRAEADCQHATLTIRTADEEGAAADTVRAATLRQSGTTLYASVRGEGGTGGGSTTIVTGGRRNVVQSVVGNNYGSIVQISGSVIGGNFAGGDVVVNGRRITGGGGTTVINGSSPIEITAVVPEGSSVIGRTQSADIVAEGAVLNVSGDTQSGDVRAGHVGQVAAHTQSGDVRVEKAAFIDAKTMSGDIRLGSTDVVEGNTMSGDITIADFGGSARLKTMSGDIRAHATTGGDLSATTISGDITVTATETALIDDLDVITSTVTGSVRAPQRRMGGSQPRRRR